MKDRNAIQISTRRTRSDVTLKFIEVVNGPLIAPGVEAFRTHLHNLVVPAGGALRSDVAAVCYTDVTH